MSQFMGPAATNQGWRPKCWDAKAEFHVVGIPNTGTLSKVYQGSDNRIERQPNSKPFTNNLKSSNGKLSMQLEHAQLSQHLLAISKLAQQEIEREKVIAECIGEEYPDDDGLPDEERTEALTTIDNLVTDSLRLLTQIRTGD